MRACTLCKHARRQEIDQALLTGESLRHIAARFDTSTSALQRHKRDHLPRSLTLAAEAREAAHGCSLLDQIRSLQETTLKVLRKAEKANDLRTAVGAIRETRGNLELMVRMAGELNPAAENQVQVLVVMPSGEAVRPAFP